MTVISLKVYITRAKCQVEGANLISGTKDVRLYLRLDFTSDLKCNGIHRLYWV